MKLVSGIEFKRNFRSLEGLKTEDKKVVKAKCIYRSGDLFDLSDIEKKTINDLNIKTIIDLRNKDKVQECPDYLDSGVKYFNVPLYNLDKSDIKNYTITNYDTPYLDSYIKSVLCSDSIEALKMIFKLIISQEKPILIHCTLGRDRTGIVCYLLEKMLDVYKEQIISDYMFSNFSSIIRLSKKIIKKDSLINGGYEDFSNYVKKFFVRQKNYETLDEVISVNYNSYENFFDSVLNIDKKIMKELFLETI